MLVADSFRIIAESQSPLLAADVARRQRPQPHLFPQPLDLSHCAALGDYARHVQIAVSELLLAAVQPDSPRLRIRPHALARVTDKRDPANVESEIGVMDDDLREVGDELSEHHLQLLRMRLPEPRPRSDERRVGKAWVRT